MFSKGQTDLIMKNAAVSITIFSSNESQSSVGNGIWEPEGGGSRTSVN